MRQHRSLGLLAVVCMLLLGMGGMGGIEAGAQEGVKGGDPRVMPINAKMLGQSYGDWSATFWQWSYAEGFVSWYDEDGSYAWEGQGGKRLFLCGTATEDPVTRYIDVPAETIIYVPIYQVIVGTLGNPETVPEGWVEYLRARADWLVGDLEEMSCQLDGVEVQNLASYRCQDSQTFPLFISGNVFWPCVCDGYCLVLKPLTVGKHTIHFTTRTAYAQSDVTYVVTVGW